MSNSIEEKISHLMGMYADDRDREDVPAMRGRVRKAEALIAEARIEELESLKRNSDYKDSVHNNQINSRIATLKKKQGSL